MKNAFEKAYYVRGNLLVKNKFGSVLSEVRLLGWRRGRGGMKQRHRVVKKTRKYF